MRNVTSLVGSEFGRLTVLKRVESTAKHAMWMCFCSCGNLHTVSTTNLKNGHSKSCGCLRKSISHSIVHGHKRGNKRTKAYSTWVNMKSRCNQPNRKDYKNYGGRGIGYDPKWEGFVGFLEDMGEPDQGMSLDRTDNDQGYSKENCKWINRSEQNNNKRNNVRYELNGKSQTLTEWAKETGVGRVTMLKRIQRGVSLDVALTHIGYLKV